MDRLNALNGVSANGELFLGYGRRAPAVAELAEFERFESAPASGLLTRLPRVYAYLNKLFRSASTVGFKLMYSQLRRYPEILVYLALRRVRIVHLVRLNGIDVIVSEELARLTGVSHATGTEIGESPSIYIDPSNLVFRLQKLRRHAKFAEWVIRLSSCPHLTVNYEAMVQGDQEFLRILGFLDIPAPARQSQSILEKRGTRAHRDSISNYGAVKQALESTPFSDLLG